MKPKAYSRSGGIEQLLLKLLYLYKRKCDSLNIHPSSAIQHWFQLGIQAEKLQLMKLHQPIGPLQMRAIMQIFQQQKYPTLTSICIWQSKISDQGLRNICKYLQLIKNNQVIILDLLENQITSLGCQFLSKILNIRTSKIQHLKLDNNQIGDKGIQSLAAGLKTNTTLTKLSLKYCGITQIGITSIQQILANINTKIRSIKLQGNPLGNYGILQFFRAIEANDILQKINLADTGLNLLDFKAQKIINILPQDKQITSNCNKTTLHQQISKNDKQDDDQQIPQNQQDDNQQNSQPDDNTSQPDQKPDTPNQQNNPDPSPFSQDPPMKIYQTPILKPKSTKLSLLSTLQKKPKTKLTRTISPNDHSLSANILKHLSFIMDKNIKIRKYDLRFNPISHDAAYILFDIIVKNNKIIDVEFNSNIPNQITINLQLLTKKRKAKFAKLAKSKKSKTSPKKKK